MPESYDHLSKSLSFVDRSALYSYASLEYTALVIYSFVVRGGSIVAKPLARFVEPLGDVANKAYRSSLNELGSAGVATKKVLTGRKSRLSVVDERVTSVEDRVSGIEARLKFLEQHGVVIPVQESAKKLRKMSAEKKKFLKAIVDENIELRD